MEKKGNRKSLVSDTNSTESFGDEPTLLQDWLGDEPTPLKDWQSFDSKTLSISVQCVQKE